MGRRWVGDGSAMGRRWVGDGSRQVMQKLEALFAGFEPLAPTMFVLSGNFTSTPFGQGSEDMKRFTALFDALAEV